MKISAKVREQAAMICAIAASTDNEYDERPTYDREVARWLDIWHGSSDKTIRDEPALGLALAAWSHAFWNQKSCAWTAETDAEAEALLRTGWTP